eukprot:9912035-Alexandrium_andersonii.AAC.1
MSASLVGSEMCIRDSGSANARRSGAWARSGRAVAGGRWRARAGDGGCAVSYTHLTLPTICSV